MIEHSLPPQSRQFYIRVRAQKHEQAMADYREQLIGLRRENAAPGSLPSGQQLLAEWQLSETFVGAMAAGLLEAALEACDLYEIPLDQNLSSCIETEIKACLRRSSAMHFETIPPRMEPRRCQHISKMCLQGGFPPPHSTS